MAKPNYRQQKKQKEQVRKTRQAEKQQRRQTRVLTETADGVVVEPADGTATSNQPKEG